MDSMVDTTIENCAPCQCNEDNTTVEPIIPSPIPETAWHSLSIDFGSRSPTNEYTLAIYDDHSRKTMVKLAKNLTTNTAITICKNLFTQYGIPATIKSDNGPAFISAEWANFAKRYNFRHQKITPLHPKANAGAERIMKATNKRIRIANVANTHWKVELSKYLNRYNQTPHSSTGYSPNMLLLGHDNCEILPNLRPRTLNEKIRAKAIENDEESKKRMKKYADIYQNTKHREFKINDPVLHAWNRTHKHQPLFDQHPYRITKKNGTMLTAMRENHAITRNSKKFKIISETCYKSAMELVNQKKEQSLPQTKYVIYPRQELRSSRLPTTITNHTPPPTPLTLTPPPIPTPQEQSTRTTPPTTVTATTRDTTSPTYNEAPRNSGPGPTDSRTRKQKRVDYKPMFRLNNKEKVLNEENDKVQTSPRRKDSTQGDFSAQGEYDIGQI